MSADSTVTSPPVDYSTMTLDALRRLAESGPDAGTRSAARREIEARTASAEPSSLECWAHVGRSGFGTAEPRLMVRLTGSSRSRRWVMAAVYNLAAELERAIAPTPERWELGVRYMTEGHGFVCLELMDGSPGEVQRAMSVLERVAGQATTGGVSGRRPGRGRRTVVTSAVTVMDNAESVMDGAVEASMPDADVGVQAAPVAAVAPVQLDEESEGRNRRRKRQRYREEAGHAAGEFEARQLADDPAMLPACARAALSGGPKSGAYWQWLLERWTAVQQSEPARAEVAS